MTEDFILFKKVKERPIRNCVDLSKNMRGKRNGFIFFTESFRIDFENKMYELSKIKEELDKKDRVIQKMAKMLNSHDIDDDICGNFGKNKYCSDFTNENLCIDCIKEYFYKKVEEEKNE